MSEDVQAIYQACLAYFLHETPVPERRRLADDPALHEVLVGPMERLTRLVAERWLQTAEGQQWAAQWEEHIAWRQQCLEAGQAVAEEAWQRPRYGPSLPVPTSPYESAMLLKRVWAARGQGQHEGTS